MQLTVGVSLSLHVYTYIACYVALAFITSAASQTGDAALLGTLFHRLFSGHHKCNRYTLIFVYSNYASVFIMGTLSHLWFFLAQ